MYTGHGASSSIPARQQPYELALKMGFDVLLSRVPPDDILRALGADRQSNAIRIPTLDRSLIVDLDARDVFVYGGGRARRAWAILAVHYLAAQDVSADTREVAFSHFPESRGYLNVFEKRIIGRFLATTGRTAEQYAKMAAELLPEALPGPGISYRFDVLPRVPIIITRYEGDDEMGSGASIIYRADIERLLPAEDRVVATELLLDSLAGKTIEESAGGPK